MQWYKTNYCNRRDWILDNAENLNLNAEELLFCLLIDFMQEHHLELSEKTLQTKLKMNGSEVDQVVRNLSSKGYLAIGVNEHLFDLSGLYENGAKHPVSDTVYETVFNVFEDTFGRPLSPNELVKLSEFSKKYDHVEIIEALRTAEAYNKISMAYIEGILRNNHHD